MKKYLVLVFLFPVFCFSQKTLTIEDPMRLDKDTIINKTKIIDSIFLQDNISLLAGSNGCFHSVYVEYTFLKKANYFEVTYIKMNGKTIKCKGTVKLDKKKTEQIHKQCIYALSIKQRWCTTRDDFELSSKTQKVSFIDDRCSGDDDIMERIGEIVGVCKDF